MFSIDTIRKNLLTELPGKSSHAKLAPFAARLYYEVPVDVFEAAVMILLLNREDQICIPLITRQSNHPDDKHSGQIGLPGGRKEKRDMDLCATSLRECAEEIGVNANQIEILGSLSPLYIPVSHHHVFPYVGYYHGNSGFTIQASEIHALHEIPLDELLRDEHRKSQALKTTEGPVRIVPTIQLGDLTIWGATAMILEEFSDIVKKNSTGL